MKAKTLNILLICKSLPWKFKGGIQTHVWELSQSLVSKGHQVTVLTGGPFKAVERSFDKAGVNIIELPFFPGRYIKPVSMLAEELSFNLTARRWVKHHHAYFDVVHAQGRSGYLLHSLKSVRSKLITTVHGLIARESNNARWYNLNARLHALLSRRIEKKLIEASGQCLAVSEDLKGDLNKQYDQPKLKVIPNGVRFPSKLPYQPENVHGRFLFVGRLHPIKGLIPLVKAMAHAPSSVCLDIMGDGPQFAELKRLIEKLNLEKKVRLLGEHSNEKVKESLPFYQALILPSHYETQGIVLIEANAQGIPVIASDLPAIRESVIHGENGLLCPTNKPHSFIEAMDYIAKRPAEAHRMGLAGRKRVIEHYSWDSIALQTIASYYKLAG